MAGKTLYLIVAVPDAFLFSSTPAVHIDSDGLGGNIQLSGVYAPQTGAPINVDYITTLDVVP